MFTPIMFQVSRPLLSLAAVAAIANVSTDALLKHLESGSIRYAFDVAAPKVSRRALRVLAASLAEHLGGQQVPAPMARRSCAPPSTPFFPPWPRTSAQKRWPASWIAIATTRSN